MKSYYCRIIVIYMLFSCFCFSSCQKIGCNAKEEGTYYQAEYYEKKTGDEIQIPHFFKDTLYWIETENDIYRLYKSGSEENQEQLVITFHENERVMDFAVLSDERIVTAKLRQQDNKQELSVELYLSNGSFDRMISIPQLQGFAAMARLKAADNDFIVLSLDQSACMIKDDGSLVWKADDLGFQISSLSVMPGNKTILMENAGQDVYINLIESNGDVSRRVGKLSADMKVVESTNGVYAIWNSVLYDIDETGNLTEILDLTSQGIDSYAVSEISKSGDSYSLCLYRQNEEKRLQVVSLKEIEQIENNKKDLFVAEFVFDSAKEAINRFNRKSVTHMAKRKEYSNDEEARMPQIDASMLASDAPDILCGFSGIDIVKYYEYAQKGAFLDVTDLISKDAYLEKAVTDMAVEGRIYGLPCSFTFLTLAGPEDALGGKELWDVNDFICFMEKHPDAFMDPDDRPENQGIRIFRIAMYRGINEFVDFENGKASFDSAGFRELLIKTYEWKTTAVTQTREERSQNGEAVLWEVYVFSPASIQEIAAKFGAERDMTLIGYPDGKYGSGGYMAYSSVLSINRKSKELQAAVELFSEWIELADEKSKLNFPIGKRGFEETIDDAKQHKYKKDRNGNILLDEMGEPIEEEQWNLNGVPIYALTSEQEEKLRNAIDTSICFAKGETRVRDIVLEEADAYFAGTIGLEDTIDKIQKRVQLYLDEMK